MAIMHSLLLISMVIAVCSANPVDSTTVISQPEVYAGSPTMCRRPNSTFCGVNYEVPDIIATLVHVIEDGIQGELNIYFETMPGQEPDACMTTTKAILCAQNFPKCEGNNVLLTSTQTCENDIETNCDADTQSRLLNNDNNNYFCSLSNEVVPLDSCSALSTFTTDNQLSEIHCGQIDDNTRISEWMFKFIQFQDRKVAAALTGLHVLAPACSSNYARYFCQFMGECNEESTVINVKNDYHFCEEILNCYDHTIADLLRPLFPCHRWLNLDYPTRPTSPPGPSSSTLAIGPSVGSIKPNPISIPLPGNGAHTLHSAGLLLYLLTVFVALFVTLL